MTGAKLRWRCRRGTRELDILLTRFLDEVYPGLSEPEQIDFESLLEEQDPDLAAWILGGETAPAQWKGVIEKIRVVVRDW